MSNQGNATAKRSLIGYAVLRANFNYEAPSYVDNFSMYVLHVLAKQHPRAVNEAEAAEAVREAFGFTIPDRVVGTLLKRAFKRGLLTTKANRFNLADGELEKIPDLEADVVQFGRQQDDLAHKFLDFVSANAPQHLHLVQDRPERHLTHFVEDHAAPLLAHALKGGQRSAQPHEPTGPEFLVNLFVDDLARTDSAAFGNLVDLVKGAILAAVVDLGTGQLGRRLNDLHFVLDTPILLKALGYQGVDQQRAVAQSIALAREHGAQVEAFPHTVKEVDGVLDSVIGVLKSRGARTGALREVDAHFLDKGSLPADIEIERGRLSATIRNLGVRELLTPDNRYRYGLDEAALEDLLEEEVHYRSASTRRYDVDSLSAIHRLRHGSAPREFERCGYVLVTDNSKVIRAARKVDERHEWPLAMFDADMSALLWVRSPAVADDLPRMQLLATVHAGMQPGGHLWAKYLDEIERLQISGDVNDDDALLLRARPEARSALMTETLGHDTVDRESIAAVLARVRDGLQQPIREELAGAMSARQAAIEAARSANEAAEAERNQREQYQVELGDMKEELGSIKNQLTGQRKFIHERAERNAERLVGGSIYLLAIILVGLASLRFVAPDALKNFPTWVGILSLVAGVGVFAVGALRHFIGGSVREWFRGIEQPIARWMERRHLQKAGLPKDTRS